MGLTPKNTAIALAIMDGKSMARAAADAGITRGRAWQIFRQFCLERMLSHEWTDDSGKPKKLREIRRAYHNWMCV